MIDMMVQPAGEAAEFQSSTRPAGRTPKLYTFHNFRVLDNEGAEIGVVDWIWADPITGQGAFIGIRLRWLLGTAQAIPVYGLRIDSQRRTLRLGYGAEQVKRARRFAIRRTLTADQQRTVWAHFDRPASIPGMIGRAGLAA